MILFYNLENFFSRSVCKTESKKNEVNSVQKNWSISRHERKLEKLNKLLEKIEENIGELPPIIGFSEIQGEEVWEEIISLPIFKLKYSYFSAHGKDQRGMGVGILINNQIVAPQKIESINLIKRLGSRNYIPREILKMECTIFEKKYNIFVVHLPSRRNKDANKSLRIEAIKNLEEEIKNSITEENTVVVIGDFNENFYDILKDKTKESRFWADAPLLHFSGPTSFHAGKGIYPDMIFQYRKRENNVVLYPTFIETFSPAFLCKTNRKNSHEPLPTFARSKYIGGLSDHFPIYTNLAK